MTNMNALFKDKPEIGATLKKTEIPVPADDEILVKVKYASICGTDAHIYKWDDWAQNRLKLPLVFGHEFAGEVLEIGKTANVMNNIKVGDIVSAETHVACNRCFECRTGNKHICENVKILGVDINGCFAEYATIPGENAWVNDKSIPGEFMSIQEPMGNAIHTIFAAKKSISDSTVLITGAGAIGIIAAAICKIFGATKVFISDVVDYRLKLAEKMGADYAINSKSENVAEFVHEKTGGRGADILLEMSGHGPALNDGLNALRAGGFAAILGVFSDPVTVDITNNIVFKYINIQGVNGRMMFDTWYKVSELLKNNMIDLKPIITHRFGLSDYKKAFEAVISGNSGKVIIPF